MHCRKRLAGIVWLSAGLLVGGATGKSPEQRVAPNILLVLAMEGDNPPELYDLSSDPGETNNLASLYPERTADLQHAFETWRAQMKPQVVPDDHPLYGRHKTMQPQ